MIDSLSISLVQDIVRREGRSLLQYARDAFPWTTAAERAALTQIERMIDEETRGTAGLVRYLTRHHQPMPYPGPYPVIFTEFNYLSLDYLVPLLMQHQKRSIAHLERDVALLHDPEARSLVQAMIAVKEKHLLAFENLALKKETPAPAPA